MLEERELLASTAIGDGIAIPHGKLDSVGQLVGALGRSVRGHRVRVDRRQADPPRLHAGRPGQLDGRAPQGAGPPVAPVPRRRLPQAPARRAGRARRCTRSSPKKTRSTDVARSWIGVRSCWARHDADAHGPVAARRERRAAAGAARRRVGPRPPHHRSSASRSRGWRWPATSGRSTPSGCRCWARPRSRTCETLSRGGGAQVGRRVLQPRPRLRRRHQGPRGARRCCARRRPAGRAAAAHAAGVVGGHRPHPEVPGAAAGADGQHPRRADGRARRRRAAAGQERHRQVRGGARPDHARPPPGRRRSGRGAPHVGQTSWSGGPPS